MGAYDGAELCELLGLYLLSQLNNIEGFNGGVYRDDCLSFTDRPVREIEHKLKKEISQIFKDCDLKLTFEPCSVTANFLNVTLNLKSGTYEPFRKENNDFLYVNAKSNHPPTITQNIPLKMKKW